MATQAKKNTNITPNTDEVVEKTNIKKDEKDLIIETLRKENEDKDKKFTELSEQFIKMQEQFKMFMNNAHNTTNEGEIVEEVLVGCRAINGAALATNDGRYNIPFSCDEEKTIDAEDLKIIFKESGYRNNRKLFEDDLFYFVHKEDYAKFKIKKRIDLSHDNLVKVLTLPTRDMIDEINKMTNNLVDFTTTHMIQFEIVKMLIDSRNPLRDWKYENRSALERYLNRKFDDLMASVGAIELLGRKKFS